MKIRQALKILLCLAFAGALPSHAVTKTWAGTSGSSWNTAVNWTPSGIPAAGDDILFNSGSYPAQLYSDVAIGSITFTSGYTGLFSFSSFKISIAGAAADFRSGGGFSGGSGSIDFTGSGAQSFIPSASLLPSVDHSGSGTVTVSVNGLNSTGFANLSGTWGWGSGLNHAVAYISGSGGSLDFGSSIVDVTGDADFSGLTGISAGTGIISFSGSGNHILTPKGGAGHPSITRVGDGALDIQSYNLACAGLTLGAGSGTVTIGTGPLTVSITGNLTANGGTLDASTNAPSVAVGGNVALSAGAAIDAGLGSLDIGGAFTMTGGTFTAPGAGAFSVGGSFTSSGGTYLPNSGTLTLDGTAGGLTLQQAGSFHHLSLNGAGGTWTASGNVTAAGTLSLTAGTLDVSANASALSAAGLSLNGGTLAAGAGSLDINGNVSMSSGTLTAPGSGNAFTVSGNFAQTGGTLTAGTGTLTLDGSGTGKTFNAAATLNAVAFSGGGEWTLTGNALTASSLALATGVLKLGAGLAHQAASASFASGTLDFESSTLRVSSNLDLNALSSIIAGTGTLEFANSGNAAFTPKSAATHPTLKQSGAGITTLTTNDVYAQGLIVDAGTFHAGTRTLTVNGNASIGGGTLDASGGALDVNGNLANSGTLSCPPGTMTVSGNFQSGAGSTLTHNGGVLVLDGVSPGKTLEILPAANTLRINGSGGSWTVSGSALSIAGTLDIQAGALNLGSALAHSAGSLATSGGSLDMATSSLQITSGNASFAALATLAAATGDLHFSGSGSQIFVPKSGVNFRHLTKSGAGTLTVSTYAYSGTGACTISAGALDLSGGFNHGCGSLTGAGSLALGSSILWLGGNADFSGLASVTASGATLNFANAAAAQFKPASGMTIAHLTQSGAGTTTLATNGLTVTGDITVSAGTLNLGAGLAHQTQNVTGTGNLHFGGSILRVTNNATFSGMGTVTAGTGTLNFNYPTGASILTPKAGQTLPAIQHDNGSTVTLATNDLQCVSFTQTAGALDLNGRDVYTTGDFSVTYGSGSSLGNLGGRLISVGGNANLAGTSVATKLNLYPGTAWTLNVTGTLSASLANLGGGTAAGTQGNCLNCSNAGGNTGWNFAVTWDGGGGNANWSNAANWGTDAVPTSADNVLFDGSSTNNVTIDAAAAAASLKMTSAYTGNFQFTTFGLSIHAGNADLRSGGTFTPGSGQISFLGNGAQTLFPAPGQTLPALQRTGTGTLTLSANPYVGGGITVGSGGTLHLGTGLTHQVAGISGSGTLNWGTSSVTATGDVDLGTLTVTLGGSNTLTFAGTGNQNFTPKAGLTGLGLAQTGSGTTTVLASNFNAPILTLGAGTFHLGTGRSHIVTTFVASGGALDFGSSQLNAYDPALDFTGLSAITPGTGALILKSATAATFKPKAGATLPNVTQSGAGGTTLIANPIVSSGNITWTTGTLNLGAGLAHSCVTLSGAGGGPYGNIDFGSSTVTLTGNANFNLTTNVIPNSGRIVFAGAGPRQVHMIPGDTLPHLELAGSGSLTLMAANVLAKAYSQSSGTLNFNGFNLATVAGGNFALTNGTSTSFSGLAGRTLTVGGNASFSGTAASSPINMDPGASWTIAVNGSLNATFAQVGNSTASVSAGSCNDCAFGPANVNWGNLVTWDGGAAGNAWSSPLNWGSDAVPGPGDDILFNATTNKSAVLDGPAGVRSITMGAGYTGDFSFSAYTLTIHGGNADFRSGGTFTAGTGGLVLAQEGANTLYPKAGAVFPNVTKTGAGTTTLAGAGLTAGDLTLGAGATVLGSGLTHSVNGISAGAGSTTLDFASSILKASGAAVDFGNLSGLTVGTGQLEFTGVSAQTFTPAPSGATPLLRQNGSGGTLLNGNASAGSLTILAGKFDLGAGRLLAVGNLYSSGGSLDFGSSTLDISETVADFSGLSQVTKGTGLLRLTGSSTLALTPAAASGFPNTTMASTGMTTLTADLSCALLTIQGGTLHLGSGRTHSAQAVASAGGTLAFNTSALQVTAGDADLSGLATLSAGTGTLAFTAATGTQVFTPKPAQTHPALYHPGSGTLRLAGSDVSCLSFTQTSGILDFNGFNLATVSGGGFTLANGNSGSFAGLGGRTIQVAGAMDLHGTPASRLNLTSATPFTLQVNGALTAWNADLSNCAASASAGAADSSRDLGGNTGWTFIDLDPPANAGNFTASALNGHDVRLAWAPPADADAHSVMLRYRTDGAYPAGETDGTLLRSVPMGRTDDTAFGLPDKSVIHFAAFVRDSSGNWSPASATARDTARTPDVTPPAGPSALAAVALGADAVALSWTPSVSADADSVMIRYRTGSAHPANAADGIHWRTVPNSRAADTLTGLAGNVIYAVGLFARDSSGNISGPQGGSQDTALYQAPVTGSIAFADANGLTRLPVAGVSLAWSGADSVRFALLPDTAAAPWRAVHASDSLDASAGPDGRRIAAARFKNTFGTLSPWYRDTTTLDRAAAAPVLSLAGAYGYLTWPNAAAGLAKDSLAGTDTVFLLRQREADNAWLNGTSWVASPDTARLRADSSFSFPFGSGLLASGYYGLTAWAKDRLGNISAPATVRIRYDANRAPETASDDARDTVLQNQPVSWTLDLGDRDLADSIVTVSASTPAWLAKTERRDTARGGFTAHRVYAWSGTPSQLHVGAHTLAVQARDAGNLVHTYTRTVHVVDVNDAPRFLPGQDSLIVQEDGLRLFVPRFADPDPSDKPTLSLLSGPAWASLSDSALAMAPGSRDTGPAAVRLAITDGRLSDTLNIQVTVRNVNDAPVAFPAGVWPASMRWNEDAVDTFSVVVVDMDKGDPINLAMQLPGFLTYTVATDAGGFNRTFRFTSAPAQGHIGAYDLRLRFQDQAGAASELPLRATVAGVNDAPSASILGIEASGGAARARLASQDPDGSPGDTRFHYRVIDAASGDTVRSGISAGTQVVIRPLADGAYRLAVSAEDEGGLRQAAYATAPFAIQGASSLALDSARWHLIAYPGRALPASALGAGASAATWDEAAADGSPLGRYATGPGADTLFRGKGYWARTARKATLSVPSSELLDNPFPLKLVRGRQGWNQVGNPYAYPIDLSATGLTFWEWNADRRDLSDARGILKPWGAYWVQVAKDTALTLKPEPWFPDTGAQGRQALAKASWNHASDWSLQLALSAGPYRDEANHIGIRPASPARSAPLSDAPKFGDFLALHLDAADGPGTLASEFRPALDADEEWWDFTVENSGTGLALAELALPGLASLEAAGLHAFLVSRGEAVALAADAPAVLSMDAPATRYSLVITPHADFAARLKGSFSLAQNFPNPVASATTFRFFLPQSWGADGKRIATGHRVRLDVYEYSGRRVARVAEGLFKPGTHSLTWQARDGAGRPLAAGNYLYRLTAPGFAKSLKLLVK